MVHLESDFEIIADAIRDFGYDIRMAALIIAVAIIFVGFCILKRKEWR